MPYHESMETRTVYLFGQSMLLTLVTGSLAQNPALHVLHAGSWAELEARAAERTPDVLIYDLDGAAENAFLPFLHQYPDLLLIGLDTESNQMLVLSSRPAQALSIADLVELIQRKDRGTERGGEAEKERGGDRLKV